MMAAVGRPMTGRPTSLVDQLVIPGMTNGTVFSEYAIILKTVFYIFAEFIWEHTLAPI